MCYGFCCCFFLLLLFFGGVGGVGLFVAQLCVIQISVFWSEYVFRLCIFYTFGLTIRVSVCVIYYVFQSASCEMCLCRSMYQ